MRTFLCLSCGEIYEETVENRDFVLGNSYGSNMYPCPKVNCSGVVIEIDEFLVSTIRNLNLLGFNTLACCSGHSQDDSVKYTKDVRTYIMFERSLDCDYISDEDLEIINKSLPEGFIIEKDNYDDMDRFVVSKTSICESESESMIKIAKNCGDLLEWTEYVLPKIIDVLFGENDSVENIDNFEILKKSGDSYFIGEEEIEHSDSPNSVVL